MPLKGYRKLTGGFTTVRAEAYTDRPLTVSCGQCIGCRLERSRQWAIRCVHEGQLHQDNCFVTLTYDDDHLPFPGTLHRPDFQKFMKRLIKKNHPIRLFYCGEYGETTDRPHYHALLFGYRPSDPELFSTSGETKLFESPSLRETWGMGHATFGELTFETAAYTARYITKKITGAKADDHYTMVDPDTGECWQKVPEFSGMSRRPGIGLPWIEKYGQDTYSKDEIILREQAMQPPRAYDNAFEVLDPQTWKIVRQARALKNAKRKPNEREGTFNKYLAQTTIAKHKLQKREFK